MAQRSISSFFFKGAAAVGGAGGSAPAAGPDVPVPLVQAVEASVATLKRKRDFAHHDAHEREHANATASTPIESCDDHDEPVLTKGKAPVPATEKAQTSGNTMDVEHVEPIDTRVPIDGADDRDLVKRDLMRSKLATAVTGAETKHQAVRQRFQFLDHSNIRDGNGRAPGHEEYDTRTVLVPPELKLSASQQQYWDVKRRYVDVVLFFKVGKFYELYERDAEVGCAALDWKMTVSGVGHCRQCGCPESGIDAAVSSLVNLGYKVGRIEQMETASQAKERTGSKTAVIRRELVMVTTPATASALDGDCVSGRFSGNRKHAVHVLALAESDSGGDDSGGENSVRNENETETETKPQTIGYAFLDAGAGVLRVGSFVDDGSNNACGLHTLLTQIAPCEVLLRVGGYTKASTKAAVQKTASKPKLVFLSRHEFPRGDGSSADSMLKEFAANSHQFTKLVETHILLAHPSETRNAVAALASHLTRLRCAAPLLSSVLQNHHVYGTEKLRLDGPTVTNLELLSGPDGGREGSLFGKLDSCVTPGGSRTLREWITGPLRNVGAIQKRQDAVAFFGGFEGSSGNNGGRMGKQSEHSDGGSTGTTTDKNETLGADTAGRLRRGLRRVPDLERCLGRARAASAADARVFPEPLARARHNRRVAAFASVVAAARDAIGFLRDVATYENFELNAPALVKELVGVASLTRLTENGARDALETARSSLDWGAKGGGDMKTAKFSVAASAAAAAAAAPALRSSRSPETQARADTCPESAMEVLCEAEQELDSRLAHFLKRAATWSAVAVSVSQLDALAALAAFASTANGPMCRPEFVPRVGDDPPVFHATNLWHPCAVAATSAGSCSKQTASSIVPNDVSLSPPAALLTGPNMGGKSTLLRATCVAVVLAQAGAPCPASQLMLSPADILFTRIGGANDRLETGESTFLVECSETANILRGATVDSVVVLDELGRGTSTFDGYAVAYASFARLAHHVGCRLLFATHYHALSKEFGKSPLVQLLHMAADVGSTNGGPNDRQIAFLYKLRPGSCPKSYGTSVAALAGVPECVLINATAAAAAMETKLSVAFGGVGVDEKPGSKSKKLTLGEVQALRQTVRATNREGLLGTWDGLARGE